MDPFAKNVAGVADLIGNPTNKQDTDAGYSPEGIVDEKYDVLDLQMDDTELLALRDEWEKRYAPYETKMKKVFERNLESYLGKKKDGQWIFDGDLPMVANLQFEAEETFLAAALAKNPEPVVYADNTPEGNAIATAVKTMLQYHFDQLVLRRKLSLTVRQWSIYHLGVLKYGWNTKINDVSVENRKIQDFIFDPNGYVDAYGDFVGSLGERINTTADELIKLAPKCKEYIEADVENKLATPITYTEWRTDEMCFATYKEKVLWKHKNEFFKYEEPMVGELGQPVLDMFGKPQMQPVRNHFAAPKKPYTFLSVFSLQEQPHDITGLIEQNIPNQNKIARQTTQIDFNVENSNNGYAYSENNFTEETATQASKARRAGRPILIPLGADPSQAIIPLAAQALPASFFTSVENHKNDLRSSWGIQGIAAQQPDDDQTARGMILDQAQDNSRIGGGIGDAIEQVADNAANWLVQLYYVFYDEEHFAAIMGGAKAVEYVTLSNQSLDRQLIVSVAPDSMKPKDDITNLNLAQALFDKGAIGPKTLLKMVDFPDPDESAADGVMYRLDPMGYFQLNFPEYAARLQQQQQQNAMTEMQNAAAGQGMNTAAVAANTPPEETTEPKGKLTSDPASASLSQIQLPQV